MNPKLIKFAINHINTQEKLVEILKILQEENVNVFDLPESSFCQLSLLSFKYLKNPSEKQKILLSDIWQHKSGKYQDIFQNEARTFSFGKKLISHTQNNLYTFQTLYENGKPKELSRFLCKYPDFFKCNHICDFNDALPTVKKTFHQSLSKAVIAHSFGMDFQYHELDQLIENGVKNPSKLYDLFNSQKSNVSAQDWDKLMVSTIKMCNSDNYGNSSIADTWFLLSKINNLQAHKAKDLVMDICLLNSDGKYFDVSHKSLSQAQYIQLYLPYILEMDFEGMAGSPIFTKLLPYLEKDKIRQCVEDGFEDMFKKSYSKKYIELIENYQDAISNADFVEALLNCASKDFNKFSTISEVVSENNRGEYLKDYFAKFKDSTTKEKVLDLCNQRSFKEQYQTAIFALMLEQGLDDKNHTKKIKL